MKQKENGGRRRGTMVQDTQQPERRPRKKRGGGQVGSHAGFQQKLTVTKKSRRRRQAAFSQDSAGPLAQRARFDQTKGIKKRLVRAAGAAEGGQTLGRPFMCLADPYIFLFFLFGFCQCDYFFMYPFFLPALQKAALGRVADGTVRLRVGRATERPRRRCVRTRPRWARATRLGRRTRS